MRLIQGLEVDMVVVLVMVGVELSLIVLLCNAGLNALKIFKDVYL